MNNWTREDVENLIHEQTLRDATLLWVILEPDFYRETTSQEFALALLDARRQLAAAPIEG